MIVCNCRRLSDRDIALAVEQRPECRSAIRLYHGLCGELFCCGRCKPDIQAMIDGPAITDNPIIG